MPGILLDVLPAVSNDLRSVLQMKRPPAEFRMRGYTTKEKLKITVGAVAALVIVGWAVVLAVTFLSVR